MSAVDSIHVIWFRVAVFILKWGGARIEDKKRMEQGRESQDRTLRREEGDFYSYTGRESSELTEAE